MRIAIGVLAAVVSAWAQDLKFPPAFEKLAARAEESVNVTLDASMLQLAGRFMEENKSDQAQAKKLISGLKGIYVRAFEFTKEGEYSDVDLEAIRSQLQAPVWSRIVSVRSNRDRENVEVYFKSEAGGQIGGLVVIAAEPRELAVVNIVGSIRPEDIGALGGQFGIPQINLGNRRATGEPAAPPPPPPPPPAGKKGKDLE